MTELVSNLPVGVWFEDDKVWAYRGSIPVVAQFQHDPCFRNDYYLLNNPRIDRGRLFLRTLKRWMILPI